MEQSFQNAENVSRFTSSVQPIRQMAENDLDTKMRAILNEPGLSQYEKMKTYDTLL